MCLMKSQQCRTPIYSIAIIVKNVQIGTNKCLVPSDLRTVDLASDSLGGPIKIGVGVG